MPTIYSPPAQTPSGMAIAEHVSEILAYTRDLEERLIRATTNPETSDLRSRIEARISILNASRQMAAGLGAQQEVDDCYLIITELRGLLLENGE